MGIQNFLFFFLMVLKTLLALSGTVEMNPGPLDPKKNNLSFAVWKLNRKKIFIIQSYRHPNLPSGNFDAYIKGLENIYNRVRNENPLLVVLTGDFNAKSPLLLEHVRDVHSAIFCYQII